MLMIKSTVNDTYDDEGAESADGPVELSNGAEPMLLVGESKRPPNRSRLMPSKNEYANVHVIPDAAGIRDGAAGAGAAAEVGIRVMEDMPSKSSPYCVGTSGQRDRATNQERAAGRRCGVGSGRRWGQQRRGGGGARVAGHGAQRVK